MTTLIGINIELAISQNALKKLKRLESSQFIYLTMGGKVLIK